MDGKSLISIGLFIVCTLQLAAQNGSPAFEFVENKGQWDNRIAFKGELTSGAFYIRKNGFTVLLHHPEDLRRALDRNHTHVPTGSRPPRETSSKPGSEKSNEVAVRSHAYNVIFEGANENIEIVPDKPIASHNNYIIGNDPSKWVMNAGIFQAVVFKNIYPHTDVRYYSENGKLKYDIIVHPGGDPNRIALRYEGVSNLSIKNKELIVKTSAGDVKELYPYSFQFSNTTGRKEIEARYELTGNNTVKFSLKNYAPASTLVIDPSLVFSSFTGSPANQYGFTATPGPNGTFFSGGIVFDQGFPTTPGAFQSIFQGGGAHPVDIGIMKFSANGGQRLYATYIGGKGNDYPHSLYSDAQGNLVVMGRSYSDDYPGTAIGTGGGSDIVVTKLNATGTGIIGSLRIGGSGHDGVNIFDMQSSGQQNPQSLMQNYGDDSRSEVVLDGNNNIYVAAQTQSDNFPHAAGASQPALEGKQDGVLMKIDPNCSGLIWSTYFGGDEDDGTFVLAINPSNQDIYVAGATQSPNLPGDKAGTINPTLVGGMDGFVARFNNNGTLLKTSYLGTPALDIVYGIQFDRLGFPYVMGITRGGWPVVNVQYSVPNSKQFVAKLEPDLSRYIYSTVYGNGGPKPNISPVAFLVDRCENVYISGWGGWSAPPAPGGGNPFDMGGVIGMPITPDAIKPNTDDRDFYFIVIKRDAESLLYATYFGQDGGYGEHVDGGTSRFDAQGVIYQAMCANCSGGATFPTTPGVVGPTNPALPQGCNLAAVKIAFNYAGVASGPKAYFNGVPDSSGCVPFTVTLRDTVRNAKSYEWNFGDGTPDVITTDAEVNHEFTTVGNFRVRLIAVDSSTCNIRDTAYLNIRVRADRAQLAFDATKLPPCESLTYRFENQSVAPASKPFGALSFTWDFGDGTRVQTGNGDITHTFPAAGTYIVRMILTDTNYCNAPDSMEVTLRVAPLVEARYETPATGCAPYEAFFNNTSLAGEDFLWDFGDGTTSTDVSPTHLYANPGTYRVRLIAIDPATCNIRDTTESTIIVSNKPTADFNYAPFPPEENKPTIFSNLSTGGIRYKWLFGDGDSTIKTTRDTVLHQYNATGVYQACLITYNEFDCTDTICKPVEAKIIPLLDVPNAFTPGRFGRNSIVRVEGFGIIRMTWKIYNRWGQKVFESADRRQGWDGTFNGNLQPMDVYAYTLDVEFSDGTKTRKTGDITLIR